MDGTTPAKADSAAKPRANASRDWMEREFARPGAGVIRQRPERMLAAGTYDIKPTAGREFHGAFATDEDGAWVCQPDGIGGYEWRLIAEPFPDFPQSGLTLLHTESFSAATSYAKDSIFTSGYRDYQIVVSITDVSALADLEMRLRTAGVDNTAASYHWIYHYGWTDGSAYAGNVASDSKWKLMDAALDPTRNRARCRIELTAPQLAVATVMDATTVAWESTIQISSEDSSGIFNNTTQFDGFKVFMTSGTFTGDVRIYGYQDTVDGAAAINVYQPLDSDLTAISALTTTAAGRGLLTLADPNADKIVFWDDSAGAFAFLEPAANLTITGTDLDATGGSSGGSIPDVLMLGGM